MSDASPHDFRPTAPWKNLRLRVNLLRQLRTFFDDHRFLEVETPLLSADTVVDRHLEPFSVEVGKQQDGSPRSFWLQTSPEFGMKRLLAAGVTTGGPRSIYQVTRAFRQDEVGPLHNPEFTMVEWYQAVDHSDNQSETALHEGMALTGRLCEALLQRGEAEQVSYATAFEQLVGLNPHTAEIKALVSAVYEHGVVPPEGLSQEDRDAWLDLLLVQCVQPHLGIERPTLLYHYPASQAALARVRTGDPPVAERFELYVDGIELANGYHELLDPKELLRRNERVNAQRAADGNPALPEESRLIAAMESGLPPSVGVALGFDRLVMLAAGAECLDDVMAFPFGRA